MIEGTAVEKVCRRDPRNKCCSYTIHKLTGIHKLLTSTGEIQLLTMATEFRWKPMPA